MRVFLFGFAFGLLCTGIFLRTDDQKICDAIWKAEGGRKASTPYGIKGHPGHERSACLATVRNTRKREFIDTLAARYCPDNRVVWAKNVKYFLR